MWPCSVPADEAAVAGCRASADLRPDDLLLLTKRPPPSGSAAAKPPSVHVIALVAKVERDEGPGRGRIMHATVNLVTGNTGGCL